MKTAVHCTVAEAATTTGVIVCTWGQEPRNMFAEFGQAVGRTELSKLCVSGKLVVPGHQLVPDPGSHPERTRKLGKALLHTPLNYALVFQRAADHPDPGGNRKGSPGHLE